MVSDLVTSFVNINIDDTESDEPMLISSIESSIKSKSSKKWESGAGENKIYSVIICICSIL